MNRDSFFSPANIWELEQSERKLVSHGVRCSLFLCGTSCFHDRQMSFFMEMCLKENVPQNSACCVFVQDSFQTLKKWVKELKEHGPEDIVVAIAGNKNDLGDIRWDFFERLSYKETNSQECCGDYTAKHSSGFVNKFLFIYFCLVTSHCHSVLYHSHLTYQWYISSPADLQLQVSRDGMEESRWLNFGPLLTMNLHPRWLSCPSLPQGGPYEGSEGLCWINCSYFHWDECQKCCQCWGALPENQ